ncbi:transmembrane and immunoglobulin domain-containing protein 1 isoform X2 [Hyperolius riggenbachi]|uniref:transmembrane and immunoglobulin domain-containing protein 1 isoform X2 n=1 Tax=Hyperolius riggenbachi TaxID=752182 RepID=UPI0035A31EF3
MRSGLGTGGRERRSSGCSADDEILFLNGHEEEHFSQLLASLALVFSPLELTIRHTLLSESFLLDLVIVAIMRYLLLSTVLLFILFQVKAINLALNGASYDNLLSVDADGSTTLQCEVINNTAAESLMWYRGSQQVNVSAVNSVNSSTICLPKVTPDDDQVSYTCLLQRDTNVKRSVLINVNYEPILTGETYLAIQEGQKAVLTCEVKANPAADMAWKKNGRLVNFPDRVEQRMSGNSWTLTITKAVKSDAANYTCVAAPTGSAEKTLMFRLDVSDRDPGLPVEAIGGAVVVGTLIIIFGLVARRDKIFKGCKCRRD